MRFTGLENGQRPNGRQEKVAEILTGIAAVYRCSACGQPSELAAEEGREGFESEEVQTDEASED
nr:MAG TPA: hypothetical protein [Caudoviricetes sp.]